MSGSPPGQQPTGTEALSIPALQCAYDDHTKRNHHVFISYRVDSDKDVAEKVWQSLEKKVNQHHHHETACVFLDKYCLKIGEDWEKGFVNAIRQCRIIVYLFSQESLEKMKKNLEAGKTLTDTLQKIFKRQAISLDPNSLEYAVQQIMGVIKHNLIQTIAPGDSLETKEDILRSLEKKLRPLEFGSEIDVLQCDPRVAILTLGYQIAKFVGDDARRAMNAKSTDDIFNTKLEGLFDHFITKTRPDY
ncbi:hypothetical protein HK405_013215 [Cladochytrium tenue]|nr:hypothetical protein HK405_013215 [Cladochytrium tenue]